MLKEQSRLRGHGCPSGQAASFHYGHLFASCPATATGTALALTFTLKQGCPCFLIEAIQLAADAVSALNRLLISISFTSLKTSVRIKRKVFPNKNLSNTTLTHAVKYCANVHNANINRIWKSVLIAGLEKMRIITIFFLQIAQIDLISNNSNVFSHISDSVPTL